MKNLSFSILTNKSENDPSFVAYIFLLDYNFRRIYLFKTPLKLFAIVVCRKDIKEPEYI